MAVIAALLVNTALGLIETEKFVEFWHREKGSFWIALIVILVTVFEDAGVAVLVGALLALLSFADSVSTGRFDAILNYQDGTREDIRGKKNLHIPQDKPIEIVTYSIAGFLGYIDSERHAANLRHLSQAKNVSHVIIRLRDLFAIDFEGQTMLQNALSDMQAKGKQVYISSANEHIKSLLPSVLSSDSKSLPYFAKTSDALAAIRKG